MSTVPDLRGPLLIGLPGRLLLDLLKEVLPPFLHLVVQVFVQPSKVVQVGVLSFAESLPDLRVSQDVLGRESHGEIDRGHPRVGVCECL